MRLRLLHGLAGAAHLGQAAAVLGLILTQNEANNDRWPLVNQGFTDVRKEWRYKLSSLLPVFPFLSSVNHVVSLAAKKHYRSLVETKQANYLRWTEYALSAGVMLWIIGTLSGIVEIRTLVSLCMLNVLLQMIGWMIERRVKEEGPRSKNVKMLMGFGFAIHITIWLPILVSFYTVIDEGDVKPPGAVYSVVWVMFVLFSSFGLLSALHGFGVVSDFKKVELGYLVLSLASKTLLTWLVYFGVLRSGQRFL